MKFKLKAKIWLTVFAIVSMFSFFSLYYFPAQQEKYLLDNYNNEVQNLANTISLGVEIALTEEIADFKPRRAFADASNDNPISGVEAEPDVPDALMDVSSELLRCVAAAERLHGRSGGEDHIDPRFPFQLLIERIDKVERCRAANQ